LAAACAAAPVLPAYTAPVGEMRCSVRLAAVGDTSGGIRVWMNAASRIRPRVMAINSAITMEKRFRNSRS